MSEYEANAYNSIDRLRQDQLSALEQFRTDFPDQAHRWLPSKRLIDLRGMEKRSFTVRQYDNAAQYVHLAER